MTESIFEPLKFKNAGFGWPVSPDRPNQPMGHAMMGNQLRAVDSANINMGHYLDPAGNTHLSIEDFANYAAFHLKGLNDQPIMLPNDILKRLHTPPKNESYAAGWIVGEAPDESPQHFHNGSLVIYYAAIFLYPKHNAAVVVATNLGSDVEPDVIKAVNSVFEKEIR